MGSRYILALVLMVVVMIAWSLIFGNRFTPEQNESELSEQTPSNGTPDVQPGEIENGISSTEETFVSQEKPDDPTVHIQTNTYDIIFNEKLAIAKKWDLIEKNENGELRFPDRSTTTKNLALNLIPENALDCLAIRFGNPILQDDLQRAKWEADKNDIQLQKTEGPQTLTFTTIIGKQLKVEKIFKFYPNGYIVDLMLRFENVTADSQTIQIGSNTPGNGYELRWGRGINADLLVHEKKAGKPGRRSTREGAKTYIGTGKPTHELKPEVASATVLWAGLNSQYFSALMIPEPELYATYRLDSLITNQTPDPLVAAPDQTAVLNIPISLLQANQTSSHAFRLYVGPNDDTLLKQITAPNDSETPINLSKVISFGFFGPLSWGMLWFVRYLYKIFGNYGVAIILLTALVKIVSFPLTRKAHVSMKKMQDLQPQLTELREKFRDDPQKLNRATMRIYKENGVNPLGGCIPWLPQIPIFWALFSLLGSAVEFRGAPFLFWIDDLSAPDVLIRLPITIPLIFLEIDAIRFLPILNGLTTWLQQKFVGGMSATPATSNTQAKIMQFMPLIFVFLFYNWASGFVLYWLCNNVFTVAQQQIQTRYFHDGESKNDVKPSK